MSWSVYMVGKPSKIIAALHEESDNLKDQSKVEFDAALPHLEELLKENFHAEHVEPTVLLQASGHGYVRDGEQINRTLSVKLEPFNGKLV